MPPLRVLVVDDEPAVRELVGQALKDRGHQAALAVDAQVALARLEREPYDALLTDVSMPGMDGLELLAQVKERWPQITIVLMSAWGTLDRALRALHLGADDFLPKPFPSLEVVTIALERACRRRETERRLAALTEVNAAKDEFLALFSHELRTPMTSLVGAVELLRAEGEGLSAETREVLDIAADSLAQLQRTLEGVLTCHELRQGRLALHRRPTDPAAIMGALLAREAARAARQRVRLPAAPASPGRTLTADARLLELALGHLLDNALKFAPPDSAVEWTLEAIDDAAVLTLSDQGPGIPPADRERVFEPFVKLAGGMTVRNRGPGLGLPIARGVIEVHGGTLTLADVPPPAAAPSALTGGARRGCRAVVRLPWPPPAARPDR